MSSDSDSIHFVNSPFQICQRQLQNVLQKYETIKDRNKTFTGGFYTDGEDDFFEENVGDLEFVKIWMEIYDAKANLDAAKANKKVEELESDASVVSFKK